MMNRLFWRIFLWFWLSMMLIAAGLIMLSPLLTRTQPRLKLWGEHAEGWVQRHIEAEATRITHRNLRMDGPPQRGHFGKNHHHPPMVTFILDKEGREIGTPSAPPKVHRLAEKALAEGHALSERSGSLHLYARPTQDVSGREVVVIGALHEAPMLTDLLDARFLLPRMAFLGLLGGLFIFWLAHHLSAPIAALRSATQALAGGDMEIRVKPDFSRRKDEIGGLAQDFNRMAERVGVLLESRVRLMQDVSHELRSPLARLSVALGLARKQDQGGALDRIGVEIDRMEELISRLLEYEKADNAADMGEEIELKALIEEIVDNARFEAGGNPFELELQPAVLQGDRRLLSSALENVLRNAVSYSPEGGHIGFRMESDGNQILIRISDEGPGVPENELEGIFQAFYRVEKARERGKGGSGMGLAIARRAIERHGGRIHARNRRSGGLEIQIRLPQSR